jgi:25S rRNA (adenine2142-N1)-methyltransferase
MSRKASRKLINYHHQLEKLRRQASEQGDATEVARIESDLSNLGGLGQYQQASLQGQSSSRGGDTSRVLLEWLPGREIREEGRVLRMLEVGALSTKNACSTCGIFDMTRIDLHSQESGIQQQDFMERPLPVDSSDKFDIISLSLVLNFVPDPAARGQMLLRTLSFLRSQSLGSHAENFVPALFLVLPRSCLDNSRYFTHTRLEELMKMLGFTKLKSKMTQKLAYSLWRLTTTTYPEVALLPKKELYPGRARNNFVITLKVPS